MIAIKFNNLSNKINATFEKNGNVITLKGDVPQNTSGFYAYTTKGVLLGTYTDYKTIYRVLDNGVQFSNDGSVWVEPKRDVIVLVNWDDKNDAEGYRPEEVKAIIFDEEITFNKENNWRETYYAVPESIDIVVQSTEEVPNYKATINGNVITYYHEVIDFNPTLEERVSDLEIAVCELADSMA